MRRARLAVLGLVAALLLAGCSEIPTVGGVQPGTTEAPNGTSIVYAPNPPAQGASPKDIVSGFVTAASAGGGFAVAKKYLTSGFAAKWKPNERVLVQQVQPTITVTGTSDLVLNVTTTATVDAQGVYTATTGTTPLPFHLVQQAGQWRIDSAPNGIVLASVVFQRNYTPWVLQYFDQSWTRLVPDRRWFPSGATSPSRDAIVSALIDGPVGAVAGGVTANALHGATLQSVDPGGAGVTTVSIDLPQSDPSTDVLSRIQQQLLQTLQLPTPTALRLFVNGRVAQPVGAILSQAPQPGAFVVADGRFGVLSSTGTFSENTALGKRIMATKPTAVTVSVRQAIAAVRTSAGDVAVVTGSAAARVVDRRPGLIAPTLDQRGWTYSVPRASPDSIQASNAKGDTVGLVADVPGTSIDAIEVSPDGTRMLVVTEKAGGSAEAFVAGILRSPDGTPSALTADHYDVDLGGNTGGALGATWVDDGEVAVLVSAPDASTDRVQVQKLGGLASALGAIPGAGSIVGTSSEDDLRILLKTGRVFSWQVPNWLEESTAAPTVSVLAVQR